MVWWYNEWASGMDWDLGGKQVGMKKIWIWRIVYIIRDHPIFCVNLQGGV